MLAGARGKAGRLVDRTQLHYWDDRRDRVELGLTRPADKGPCWMGRGHLAPQDRPGAVGARAVSDRQEMDKQWLLGMEEVEPRMTAMYGWLERTYEDEDWMKTTHFANLFKTMKSAF